MVHEFCEFHVEIKRGNQFLTDPPRLAVDVCINRVGDFYALPGHEQ